MPIQVPNSAQGAFSGTMNTGSKIELPFPAPAFYILNGDANLEELRNVQYYGGWAAALENVRAAAEKWENCPFPIPGFQQKDLRPKRGAAVPSLVARSLIVAPIGMREFSTIKVGDQSKRIAPFTKGARPAIQVIVMLAHLGEDKKSIHSWAPAMLTANGYQVNHVKRAFGDWKKAIKPFMGQIAPGMPEDVTNLFWMNIGTFGEIRKDEPHGESSITPVSAFIPEDITAEQVERRYVGAEIAEFMAGLAVQSAEWLKAYQKLDAQSAPVEPEDISQLPPEDDIPF
jgi:hypothetical protein